MINFLSFYGYNHKNFIFTVFFRFTTIKYRPACIQKTTSNHEGNDTKVIV
jgi:hypothetical protein